jgi:hypothetical protein
MLGRRIVRSAVDPECTATCLAPATDSHHTECAGLPWWSFGSRRARIAGGGSRHTLCTKPDKTCFLLVLLSVDVAQARARERLALLGQFGQAQAVHG